MDQNPKKTIIELISEKYKKQILINKEEISYKIKNKTKKNNNLNKLKDLTSEIIKVKKFILR
jgi:hypothetical protein